MHDTPESPVLSIAIATPSNSFFVDSCSTAAAARTPQQCAIEAYDVLYATCAIFELDAPRCYIGALSAYFKKSVPPADARRKDARRQGYTRATKKQRSQQQSTRARSRFALARQHRHYRHRSLQARRTAHSHVSSMIRESGKILPGAVQTLCPIFFKKKGI